MWLDKKTRGKLLKIANNSPKCEKIIREAESTYGCAIQDEDYDRARLIECELRKMIDKYDEWCNKMLIVEESFVCKVNKALAIGDSKEVCDLTIERLGVLNWARNIGKPQTSVGIRLMFDKCSGGEKADALDLGSRGCNTP